MYKNIIGACLILILSEDFVGHFILLFTLLKIIFTACIFHSVHFNGYIISKMQTSWVFTNGYK